MDNMLGYSKSFCTKSNILINKTASTKKCSLYGSHKLP